MFVDLRKAYDSVPRMALWIALQKLGVPSDLITLIRSFHQDMKARLRIDGNLLEEIEVPSEYYLLVVGDGQCLLMAKVLSQVWSSFVESRTPFDGAT